MWFMAVAVVALGSSCKAKAAGYRRDQALLAPSNPPAGQYGPMKETHAHSPGAETRLNNILARRSPEAAQREAVARDDRDQGRQLDAAVPEGAGPYWTTQVASPRSERPAQSPPPVTTTALPSAATPATLALRTRRLDRPVSSTLAPATG